MSRRCCCDRPCLIESDDFNRADNTDLGAKWWEFGDLEISSLKLKSNAADSHAVAKKRHPVSTVTGIVQVEIHEIASRRYRVFLNCGVTLDAFGEIATILDYEYAEFEDTGTTQYLRIGTYTGGVLEEVELGPGTVSAGAVLQICRDESGIYAEVDVSTYVYACTASGNPTYRYAGVAAMESGTHLLDDFQFIEHKTTNSICPACECDCDGRCLPKTLTLTFFASGACACLNGATITLTRETVVGGEGYTVPCVWSGSAMLPDPFSCLSAYYEFQLVHNGGCITEGWLLCAVSNPAHDVGWTAAAGCTTGIGAAAYHNACQCDPLIIDFGPFYASQSGEPPLECDYNIRITE